MAEPIQVGEGGAGGNRRVLVLAGVAGALLLVVVVLPGLLFGGDDGGTPLEDSFPATGATTPTTVPVADAPAETFQVFSSKNPFRPLVAVSPPAEDGDATGGEAIDDPTTTDDGTFDDDFVVPGEEFEVPADGGAPPDDGGAPPDDGQGATTTTTAGPPPRQPDRVSLLEVFSDASGRVVASVRVNDITHQVAEGDEFATSYRVVDLDLSTRCAELLFGDDRFGLCEGDEVLK